MKTFFFQLLVVGSLTTSFSVLANSKIEVVESVSASEQQRVTQQQASNDEQNRLVLQLLGDLQAMQAEVLRLSGVVEEQQFQIDQLKQQQQEDYIQIDQRLSQLVNPVVSHSEPIATSAVASSDDDKNAYQKAYNFIPERQFEQSKQAFLAFVKQYPNSQYQANAYYWLGELYIIEGNDKQAKESFRKILTDYSQHNKYPEALYKVATLNHQQGDKATAKQQLETLLKQYGDIHAHANITAKARAFLQKNYP